MWFAGHLVFLTSFMASIVCIVMWKQLLAWLFSGHFWNSSHTHHSYIQRDPHKDTCERVDYLFIWHKKQKDKQEPFTEKMKRSLDEKHTQNQCVFITVCSQTFTPVLLIKTFVIVETFQLSFRVFVSFVRRSLHFFGKRFFFPFLLFLLSLPRYYPFHVVYLFIYLFVYLLLILTHASIVVNPSQDLRKYNRSRIRGRRWGSVTLFRFHWQYINFGAKEVLIIFYFYLLLLLLFFFFFAYWFWTIKYVT